MEGKVGEGGYRRDLSPTRPGEPFRADTVHYYTYPLNVKVTLPVIEPAESVPTLTAIARSSRLMLTGSTSLGHMPRAHLDGITSNEWVTL